MIYKYLKKFRRVISLVVIVCVIIPFVSACGNRDNNLGVNDVIRSQTVGVGGNINAYTTYRQAKFMEMDKDMYYSYLLSYRSFILVVLPRAKDNPDTEAKESDYPNQTNLMFQAVYNGVSPYAEQVVNGDFSLLNPEYKLLIYYVLADDFLSWEAEAIEEENKSFITSALDYLGPSELKNYEFKDNMGIGPAVVRNKEKYSLKNITNMNSYVSECDFVAVNNRYEKESYNSSLYSSNTKAKCGQDDNGEIGGKNVIADVINGDPETSGVTLLYSGGGMTGYFTYDQVREYDFNGVSWIKQLYKEYGSIGKYVEHLMGESVGCNDDKDMEINGEKVCDSNKIAEYATQMEYKLKYDLALLGRIDNINYNTLLDINASVDVTDAITDANKDEYIKMLNGTTDYNDGDYITFTTAGGFIMDRGDIFVQSMTDLLGVTNLLEMLTQMDACTNRTLASYVAEMLATVGIVVGGIATTVGTAIAIGVYVAGKTASLVSLATLGSVSLSVPGAGWIVGGVLLAAAGLTALFFGLTTKTAINETDSANFCEVYREALIDIIDMSNIKIPIYNYNIPEDPNYHASICYAGQYIKQEDGSFKCGSINDDGTFKKSDWDVPLFKMANRSEVNELGVLNGAPSIRLYSKGRFVDEIYGAASAQYIYAILDSWGVTSASSMKYYVGFEASNQQRFSVYDLLYEDEKHNKIKDIKYCVTTKFGSDCGESGRSLKDKIDDKGRIKNGVLTTEVHTDISSMNNTLLNDIKSGEEGNFKHVTAEQIKPLLETLKSYHDKYGQIVVTENNGLKQFVIGEETFYIKEKEINEKEINGANAVYIVDGDGEETLMDSGGDGKFEYTDPDTGNKVTFAFKVSENESTGETVYTLECTTDSIDVILSEINDLFAGSAADVLNSFKEDLSFSDSAETFDSLMSSLKNNLKELKVEKTVKTYLTVSVTEEDEKGKTSVISNSTLYGNQSIYIIYLEEGALDEN